jgi:GWxTD domain-containing protein
MKKILSTLILINLLFISSLQAKNVQALFSHNTFSLPEKGPYIETYLSVAGNSVQYVKTANGKFQGSIQITLTFEQNNVMKYADKYVLLSPEVTDTNHIAFQFIDQQRIPLTNGEYDLTLSIGDKNSTNAPFDYKEKIKINMSADAVTLSNVELFESKTKTETVSKFTKSGYDILPLVSTYYPKEVKKIQFYTEIYNTQKVFKDSAFLVRYYIQNEQKGYLVEPYSNFYKLKPAEANIVMGEFNIEKLSSGNYNLVVEVKNQKNKVIARQYTFFQRNNNYVQEPLSDSALAAIDINSTFASYYTNKDTLIDYIKSLRPIANNNETAFIIDKDKNLDLKLMQQFLYGFWDKHNPINPKAAWEIYHKNVQAVNESYGTRLLKGYETDRGRVYLKYGPPNAVVSNLNEPNYYPYQIWHYYKLDKQSNKKFVFFNPDLVTNDFTLIHSTAKGEIYDEKWQYMLKSRNTPNGTVDNTFSRDPKLDDDFNAPH